LLAPSTVTGWLRRLERDGEDALVRVPVPVNRFPDYVGYLVREIALVFPALGRRKISEFLARGSLHLSASTVRRALAKPLDDGDGPSGTSGRSWGAGEQAPSSEPAGASNRTVSARHPGHVWNIDITVVPTAEGFWCAALPWSWPTVWPFSWHVAAIVDHFSRRVVGFEVYPWAPSAREICGLIDTTVASEGRAPKYIISDQGVQFRTEYVDCCERHGIRPRFGAVGRSGSITLIERFWSTLKQEGLRRILVPFRIDSLREELRVFCLWYNGVRPHSSLGGATPEEIHFGSQPARDGPRFEPRKRFPLKTKPSRRAPKAVRGKRGVKLAVVVSHFEGRKHLPVIELRRAA
jgi:transposase InsO family protein